MKRFRFLDFVSPRELTQYESESLQNAGVKLARKPIGVGVVSMVMHSIFGETCCIHWADGSETVMHANNLVHAWKDTV